MKILVFFCYLLYFSTAMEIYVISGIANVNFIVIRR